jgi:hypothetical protein
LSKSVAATRLDLDESDRALSLDDEVDVSMSAPESSLQYPPSGAPKPPLRDTLTQLSERLPGR